MYSDFPDPITLVLKRKGIIKVLRIGRVDSKCWYRPEVATSCNFFFTDCFINFFGCLFNCRIEEVGQLKFGKYGMYLGLMFARHAEHLYYLGNRVFLTPVPLNNSGNSFFSLSGTFKFVLWNKQVEGHPFCVGYKKGKLRHHLHCADKGLTCSFHYLHYLTFGPASFSSYKESHLNLIAMKGSVKVPVRYEYVFFNIIGNNKAISHPGHIYCPANCCPLLLHLVATGLCLFQEATILQLFQHLVYLSSQMRIVYLQPGTYLFVVKHLASITFKDFTDKLCELRFREII